RPSSASRRAEEMGMVRRVQSRLPEWPWSDIIGGIVALIFVVCLGVISTHALILAGEWHLP
ncbi:MAG: hypothetical protein ABF959_06545, partial [Gluconobacter albidus]